MLVYLTEVRFESVRLARSFENNKNKEKVLREVSSRSVLKARLSQSLSENYRAKRRTARDALFQLLAYQTIVSRFFVESSMDFREKTWKSRKHRRSC